MSAPVVLVHSTTSLLLPLKPQPKEPAQPEFWSSEQRVASYRNMSRSATEVSNWISARTVAPASTTKP